MEYTSGASTLLSRCRFYLSEKREGLRVFHPQLRVELCGDAAACEDRRVFLYSRGLKRLPARLPLTGSPRRTPPSLLTRTPLCLNPGAASIIHAASGAARHPPPVLTCASLAGAD